MFVYMSIHIYILEDKMENCTEQMSKEITNINYDPRFSKNKPKAS